MSDYDTLMELRDDVVGLVDSLVNAALGAIDAERTRRIAAEDRADRLIELMEKEAATKTAMAKAAPQII